MLGRDILRAIGSLAFLLCLTSCVVAQMPPAWAAWKDLLNHIPDATALNRTRITNGLTNQAMTVRIIEDADGRHEKLDTYAIDIARLPKAAWMAASEQFVSRIRANSGAAIEEAAVVTSRLTKSSRTISSVPIMLLGAGVCPISGNRQFGSRRVAHCARQIIKWAVDRHDGRILCVVGSSLTTLKTNKKLTFGGTEGLSRDLQTKIVNFICANGRKTKVGAVAMHWSP